MKFSTKKRIKFGLAVIVLFAGFYFFSLLGASAYSIGMGALGVAVFNVVFWPEVWWNFNNEVRGRRRLHYFLASLIAPAALLLMAPLLQHSFDQRANDANSAPRAE